MRIKFFAIVFAAALLIAQGSAWAKPVNPNSDEDVAELKADAESGDRGAQYELSMVYTFRQDGASALKWLTTSAENGFGKAQYTLGNLYYTGSDTVKKDYEQAVKWFEASKETVYKGRKVDELIASAKQKLEEQKNAAVIKKKAAEDAKKKAIVEAARKAKEATEAARKAVEEAMAASLKAARAAALQTAADTAEKSVVPVSENTESLFKNLFQKIKDKILSYFN